MPIYQTEALRRDAFGNLSVVEVTVNDADGQFVSEETGTEYRVNGVSLGADAPVLRFADSTLTFADGSLQFPTAVSFSDGTADYFLLDARFDPNEVVAQTVPVPGAVIGSVRQPAYGLMTQGALPRTGDALLVNLSSGIALSGHGQVGLWDDDETIELSAETGVIPEFAGLETSGTARPVTEVRSGGPLNMVLVRVDYTTASGSGSFEAIQLARDYASIFAYLIPRNGHADLSSLTGITAITLLAPSLDGDAWADFGLAPGQRSEAGSPAGDEMLSTLGADHLTSQNGSDTLFGGRGDDILNGGGATDWLYGGMNNDILEGGGGQDSLYGGVGDDTVSGDDGVDYIWGGGGTNVLNGGLGADRIWGGHNTDIITGGDDADVIRGEAGVDTIWGGLGNDTLIGGAGVDVIRGEDGADVLFGGGGKDRLYGGSSGDLIADGNGNDTMNGGGGADTFVLVADGSTDEIEDFGDTSDLIDLDVAFGALGIITVVPGEVHITHSGELLILRDLAGTLTDAQLTAADFI